jgi:NAD(P)-dependent dehydrogenase (short-subunit alcohol dehydrogenase family)
MNATERQTTGALFLPLHIASRALGWVVNPHGRVSDDELREAVSGKVVLVTGASYGIGEATARKLGAAGATVLAVARSEDRLAELRAEASRSSGNVYAYPTDLSDAESVDALVSEVLERHGHVDVIVNNAGKSIRRSIELSYERFHDFQRTIDVNYLGPVKLLLAFLPSMRERGSGHIVNVSTIGVRVPPAPRWAAYQASKAAFDVFLRSVAVEAEADGVTTTSIYMALVRTRMSAPTPVFRYVPGMTPEEAANLVCKAIVDRPKVIGPWWAGAAEAGFAISRRPWEMVTGLWSNRTRDTKAAAMAVRDSRRTASKRSDRPGVARPGDVD